MTPIRYLALLVAIGGEAQTVSFGGAAGTHLTNSYTKPQWLETRVGARSLIAGPRIGIHLSPRVSLEVNALHRTMRHDRFSVPGFGTFSRKFTAWEFPVLFRYRLTDGPVRPFVEAGPSLRAFRDKAGQPSSYGITAGAGAEFRAGRMSLAPVFRYTRWAADKPSPDVPTAVNQVQLLFTAGYRTTPASRKPFGHKLWLGIVGGLPLTGDLVEDQERVGPYTGEVERFFDVRFVGGLTAEADVTERLAVEVNGLYRRLHFRDSPSVVVTWQFPVLAKWRLNGGGVRPFLEAGPSFRVAGNLNGTNPSHAGLTAGVGVEIRKSPVRFAPAVRYTRWAADGRGLNRTRSNQVELLVGFSF